MTCWRWVISSTVESHFAVFLCGFDVPLREIDSFARDVLRKGAKKLRHYLAGEINAPEGGSPDILVRSECEKLF